jgi:hypothetical protein
MKTSKAKTISKTKEPPKSGDEVKKKKVTAGKSKPSEGEIREKAMEIYNQRIERGEYGTAEDDWREAEEFLKSSIDE